MPTAWMRGMGSVRDHDLRAHERRAATDGPEAEAALPITFEGDIGKRWSK